MQSWIFFSFSYSWQLRPRRRELSAKVVHWSVEVMLQIALNKKNLLSHCLYASAWKIPADFLLIFFVFYAKIRMKLALDARTMVALLASFFNIRTTKQLNIIQECILKPFAACTNHHRPGWRAVSQSPHGWLGLWGEMKAPLGHFKGNQTLN